MHRFALIVVVAMSAALSAAAESTAKCSTAGDESVSLLQTALQPSAPRTVTDPPTGATGASPPASEHHEDESNWAIISHQFVDTQTDDHQGSCGVLLTEVVIKQSKLTKSSHGRKGVRKFCSHTESRDFGRGAFGSVKSGYGVLEGGRKLPLALKFGDKNQIANYNTELNILVHFKKDTRHIVEIYGFDESQTLLALEPLMGGSLKEVLKPPTLLLGDSDAKKVMLSVVKAAADCHGHHVAHRDIKEDNYVFKKHIAGDWGTLLKLIDFGISLRLERHHLKNPNPKQAWDWGVMGTPGYIAPELYYNDYAKRGKISGGLRKFSAYAPDIFAVGTIAYKLFTGKLLIDQLNYEYKQASQDTSSRGKREAFKRMIEEGSDDKVETILKKDTAFYKDDAFTPAGEFVRKAVKMHPDHRATAAQLLKEPWLS